MSVRFGTDGVRGVANAEITAEIALAIGRATARVFAARAAVVIGRDTRRSGPMLEAAVAAGVCAEGADAVLLGVVPTPAVAVGSARDGVPGVIISASHNPFADNGIKLFAPGGRKLTDAEQAEVEAAIADVLRRRRAAGLDRRRASARCATDARRRGRRATSRPSSPRSRAATWTGCAWSSTAPTVPPRTVAPAGAPRARAPRSRCCRADPDGTQHQRGCGSTHPAALQRAVVADGADVGIAFDGDADRLLAVDHTGALVDGDQIIAMCALDLRRTRAARPPTPWW